MAKTAQASEAAMKARDPNVDHDVKVRRALGVVIHARGGNQDGNAPLVIRTGQNDTDVLEIAQESNAHYLEKLATIDPIASFIDTGSGRRPPRSRAADTHSRIETCATSSPGGPTDAVDLPADLQALLSAARKAIGLEVAAAVWQAYRLGLLARAATGRRGPSGKSMIAECAQSLGMSRQSLQRLASFPTHWTPEEVSVALDRALRSAVVLSVSHYLAIGRLPRSARAAWMDRVVSGRMDLRTLRRELTAHL